jgi:hypothetical protein
LHKSICFNFNRALTLAAILSVLQSSRALMCDTTISLTHPHAPDLVVTPALLLARMGANYHGYGAFARDTSLSGNYLEALNYRPDNIRSAQTISYESGSGIARQ